MVVGVEMEVEDKGASVEFSSPHMLGMEEVLWSFVVRKGSTLQWRSTVALNNLKLSSADDWETNKSTPTDHATAHQVSSTQANV